MNVPGIRLVEKALYLFESSGYTFICSFERYQRLSNHNSVSRFKQPAELETFFSIQFTWSLNGSIIWNFSMSQI